MSGMLYSFSLVTGVLEERPLGRAPRHHRAPRPRPDARVSHREGILDGVFAAPGEPLDDVAVDARPDKVRLGVEVLRLDDERVSFPVAARHAQPLPDVIGQVGLVGHRDETEVVDLFLKDDDVFGRLQDLV